MEDVMICRSLSFIIPGPLETSVLVEEVMGDAGHTVLKFTVTALENGLQADLRGLFWDVSDESLLAGMRVVPDQSPDITDSAFAADAVTDLGGGANMKGDLTNKGRGFDAGVEVGTQGIGKDDIDQTSFEIAVDGQDLTLDAIGGMRFGVRYTSVGPAGHRSDSLKLAGAAPNAPDAIDDALVTDEDTAAAINLLANDTDADGDPLTVTSIEGGIVGAGFAVVSDGGRTGQVTVQADGTFAFDPDGGFEDLSTGETDGFDLVYHIGDGAGGADCATVTVTVTGVNDAPVANPDVFFVEYGDTAFADVAANDTDVDGVVVPSTIMVSGADLGVATEQGGLLRYDAVAIVHDATDDSAEDAMTYTIADDEGLVSAPGSVTAKVIDPMRETDLDSSADAKGQLLELSLATEDRTFNTSSFVEIGVQAGDLAQFVNVSFVIDGSGSVSSAEYAQQRLAVQNAIDDLRAEYAGSVATVTVQLVQFSSGAASAVHDLFSAALNDVAVGTPISTYQDGSSTNYNAALSTASGFFAGKGAEDNFLLFASDGQPNTGGAYLDDVAAMDALNVSITAVGFGSGVSLATLNEIDNTGGAQIVANAAALGDVFADSPLFSADLVTFSLTVNGVDQGIGVGDLADLGGGDYSFAGTLLGLDNSHGFANLVEVNAGFDVDRDGVADEFRLVRTTIDGTDGSDVLFA